MAAVFLVTLYEYSPLFYIAVVFTCFIVTTGLVLGWFGWDVPVILRNSEETQFSTRAFKKQMRQVKNPFGLEITNASSASLAALGLTCCIFSSGSLRTANKEINRAFLPSSPQ